MPASRRAPSSPRLPALQLRLQHLRLGGGGRRFAGRGNHGRREAIGIACIRHQLLPNGRYDEARGTRESAYQGRYEVKGNQIDYWDDTGFTADGVFVDENTLHHGGMIFRRR